MTGVIRRGQAANSNQRKPAGFHPASGREAGSPASADFFSDPETTKTLYLDFGEDALSVLQKLKRTGADTVILVIPKGAKIFGSPVNFRLLRQQAASLKKALAVATADEHGATLVTKTGLPLVNPAESDFPAGAQRAGERVLGDIRNRSRKPIARTVTPARRDQPGSDSGQKNRISEQALINLIGPDSSGGSEIVLPQPVRTWHIKWRYIIWSLGLVSALAVILGVFVLPAATVTITPRTEPVIRDIELQVNNSAIAPDSQNLILPGQKISEEIGGTRPYPTTGVKEVGEKASGFVTIYNFSGTTLILKKATTRLEAGGKVFYFLQDVGGIRPTSRISGSDQADPATLTESVPIVAAEPGDGYNLPADTRFEIFNEVFGHQSDVLYAANSNPVSGGTTQQIKIVSEGDIASARQAIRTELVAQLREKLTDTLTADSRLADNAFTAEVLEESLSHQVGAETAEFQLTQRLRVNALIYHESEVRQLIIDRITRLLPENKFLLPPSQEKFSADFVSIDIGGGIGTLRAHFETQARYDVNTEFLARTLRGRSASQVKEILLARPEIQDVVVEFSPGWVTSVPRYSRNFVLKLSE